MSSTEPSPTRVAVVIEDDTDIRNLLETVLTQAGFSVVGRSTGVDGIEAVREHDPVVTTLDVNMPGIDGFETARRIRQFSSTYIIMLTALDEEIDTLRGLEAGADDYITKPFRPRELRARVEAMLRRPRATSATSAAAPPSAQTPPGIDTVDGGWIEHRGLRVNAEMRLVERDGDELSLTRSEFELLSALLESGRRVLTKSDLARVLRGDDYASDYISEADKRGVEVHMGNLRKKLGESVGDPRWIETVRGVGYRTTA